MKLRTVRPGLYETPDGAYMVERVDGEWYITASRRMHEVVAAPQPTLRDCRERITEGGF